MKVIFNCSIYDWHEEYCIDVAAEITKRGGTAIIEKEGAVYPDADFTIQPDEACKRLGGRGVWINHAMAVIPENSFYIDRSFKQDIQRNTDFIFTFSPAWQPFWERFQKPIHVVGMPKLDTLFTAKRPAPIIFYGPTWNEELTSLSVVNVDALQKWGTVLFFRHPSQEHPDRLSSREALRQASIVISDYSSIGLEAITLRIPTILVDREPWASRTATHISGLARAAAICVQDQGGIERALTIYQKNPDYLAAERQEFSERLCSYQGQSAVRTVDVLESLLV